MWYHCKTLLISTTFSTFRCNPIVFYCNSFQSSCWLQLDFCTASLPPNPQAYLHLKLSHWESCLFFLEDIPSWGLKVPFVLLLCIVNYSFCILSIYLPFLGLYWHLNILIFTSLHVPLYLLLLSALSLCLYFLTQPQISFCLPQLPHISFLLKLMNKVCETKCYRLVFLLEIFSSPHSPGLPASVSGKVEHWRR